MSERDPAAAATAAGIALDALTLSGNDEPVATDSDVVVLIGPNNSGKSRALREIESYVRTGDAGAVVRAVEVRGRGSREELEAWLLATTVPHPHNPQYRTWTGHSVFTLEPYLSNWGASCTPLLDLTGVFLLRADAETRLQLSASVPSIDIRDGLPAEPLQRLLRDHSGEQMLSRAVERAFGTPVHVNRAGGATVHLHLGTASAEPRLDSAEYAEQLRALPLVSEQGDGMRSFIGLLLTIDAAPYSVVLIDEPEAFLHPPQERELGRQLAVPKDRQVVVATHSSNVLLGLLDGEAKTTVIRLTRRGDANVASVLDAERVKQLWNDPALRYSGLLDGLFHRGVVVCEAEGDARVYAAALDEQREQSGQPASDLLLTSCGGKHKAPAAVDALRPLDVPVAVIADLDVLRDDGLLRRLVASLDGDWEAVEADWRQLSAAVAGHPTPAPRVETVLDQIVATVGEDRSAPLTEQQSRRIREIVKVPDGWKQARNDGGVETLPRGQAVETAQRLIERLSSFGLFVVPVGALEGWARDVGGHGAGFADRFLGARRHADHPALQAFVADVAAFLRRLEAGDP